ncbi:MAG: SagB/ThcOx family dehydrogenase [Gammaproteobacteria bacterium]|nr:SagB/ThcOx family dehydrogenase [Gammaproteobacteria bacterium]MYL12623.1 SagB/ThcOx family dehydrogenase [Gammaproteobacteria bacterium]
MNKVLEILRSEEQADAAVHFDMWSLLEPENKKLLDLIIERLLNRQKQGKKTDELTLALEGQKQDMASGQKVMRNALFNDKPSYAPLGDDVERVPMPIEHRLNEESFLKLVRRRESVRDYTSEPVSLQAIATILFLSYGIRLEMPISKDQPIPYFLNSPSGGGLMSTRLYFVAMNVEGLKRGLYQFDTQSFSMELISHGEVRGKMYELCSYQDWVTRAGGVFVLVSDLDRLSWKYEKRSYRLTHLDAGVLGQSLHLAATSVGLGSSMLFGFFDDEMNQFIGVDGDRRFVSLLLTVGNPVPKYSSLSGDLAKDSRN